MSLSFLQAASEAPDRVAVVAGGICLTYAELAPRVAAAGADLERRLVGGVGDGPRVAVVGSRRMSVLIVLWALVERGIPFVLLHPRATTKEQQRLLAELGDPILVDERWSEPPANGAPMRRPVPARPVPDDERCCAVVFTSGTTGAPKGALLSRRAFVAAARASEANLGWCEEDRWLLAMPLSHVGGLSIVLRCLLARRTVVLAEEAPFDACAMAELLERDRVSLASLVPTMLWRLIEMEPRWQAPRHLRAILLGGAPASSGLLGRAADRGLPVLTTYGLTEACSQVATQPAGTVNRGELGAGRVVDGVELRVTRWPGDGEDEGTIEIRGATLFSGYLGSEACDRFTSDGWLRTGDVGRLDRGGFLHVLGRRGDLVISGGENVHPQEVEEALEHHPSIDRACVFGIDDEEWGEVVAAALKPGAGGPLADGELLAFLAGRLASHKRPRFRCWVESLAETPSGKVDRQRVRRECAARLRPLVGDPPSVSSPAEPEVEAD